MKISFKIYRVIHLLWTGILTFLMSIPILERGRINRDVIGESFFSAIWLVGIVLLYETYERFLNSLGSLLRREYNNYK